MSSMTRCLTDRTMRSKLFVSRGCSASGVVAAGELPAPLYPSRSGKRGVTTHGTNVAAYEGCDMVIELGVRMQNCRELTR